ncbi:MAG: efflux RND transporter permease subunit, partial [Mariniphaga sp.]
MRRKGDIKWLFLSFLWLGPAYGQSDLIPLLELAEENYPLIAARQAEAEAAQANVAIEKSTLLPSLDAAYQANYSTYNNITGMSYPGQLLPISGPPTAENFNNPVPGSAVSLLLKWAPFTFGQRTASVEYNRKLYEKQLAGLEDEVLRLKFRVAFIYLEIASTKELIEVYRKNIERNEFDQSGYVINSLKNLLFEGGLGAILTGLMVLLFLGDRRGALIVILTIPIALLTSVIFLNMAGQTINIMTLGGLALSVGILVDEATVTIENIHRHMEMGKSKAKAILEGCKEIVTPKLLILFSILAVFVPALFMSGVPRGMFLPMSLAVGFAMIASFTLSMTFVPVMAVWIMKHLKNEEDETSRFGRFKTRYLGFIRRLSGKSSLSLAVYFILALGLVAFGFYSIGIDIFPKVDAGQTQVRLRMATGTRVERTEEATKELLNIAEDIVGEGNVEISSAFIGTQPSSFPVNLIHLWTSGPHEAAIRINLSEDSHYPIEEFKEEMRARFKERFPNAQLSFEPGDLVDQVMNLGSTNPIEVAVLGRNQESSLSVAERLKDDLEAIPFFCDVQITTPLDYPAMKINIDRVKAGQLGLSVDNIARSIVAATSSSRFTQPNYWRDPVSG